MRPIYLHIEGKSPTLVQGCDKILTSGSKTNTRAARQPLHTAVHNNHKRAQAVHTDVLTDPDQEHLLTKLARATQNTVKTIIYRLAHN